jgi:tripartite-type tricarboxylate transporter receptor subunit TctC
MTRNHFSRVRRQVLLGLGALGLAPQTFAQGNSNKIVKVIVGFPAGQATDQVARMLAEKMQGVTGDNYVIENRPGQGGSIALGQLAHSNNNGSVMMLAHMSAIATNPHIYKSINYDSQKDFSAAGLVGDLPFVLAVNPNLPIKNLKELVDYAKANPTTMSNSSSGIGTVSHLALEEFKRRAGIQSLHVPYSGSVAGLTDVIAGNLTMALETASAIRPHVESGKLRVISVGSSKRLGGVYKDTPTFIEQGYKDFTAATWIMYIYPSGTPKSEINATYNSVMKVMSSPEVDQKLISIGCIPRTFSSIDECNHYLQKEYLNWGEIVARNNVSKV